MLQICNIRVSFLDTLKLEETNHTVFSSSSKQNFYRLNLILRDGDRYTLQSKGGLDIALLHTKTGDGLRKLESLASVRYDAYVTVGEWLEHVRIWRADGKRTNLTIKVNVYGFTCDVDIVGKELSKASIYLQHPDHHDKQVKYDNPHFFKLPQIEMPDLESSAATPSEIDFVDLHSVLETLDRNDSLKQAAIDHRVKTTLLPWVYLSQVLSLY